MATFWPASHASSIRGSPQWKILEPPMSQTVFFPWSLVTVICKVGHGRRLNPLGLTVGRFSFVPLGKYLTVEFFYFRLPDGWAKHFPCTALLIWSSVLFSKWCGFGPQFWLKLATKLVLPRIQVGKNSLWSGVPLIWIQIVTHSDHRSEHDWHLFGHQWDCSFCIFFCNVKI